MICELFCILGCSFQTDRAGPGLYYDLLHHSLHSLFGLCQSYPVICQGIFLDCPISMNVLIQTLIHGLPTFLVATHSILTFQMRSGMGHLGSLGVISLAVHTM